MICRTYIPLTPENKKTHIIIILENAKILLLFTIIGTDACGDWC
jgi:hypothetical protein